MAERLLFMDEILDQEIISWLKELENIQEGKPQYSLPSFLKPFHLITLGLAIKKAGRKIFELPKPLERYAIRMGLWDIIEEKPPYDVLHRPEEGKFIPIQKFRDRKDEDEIHDKVLALTKAQFSEYPADEKALKSCLLEIINNFFDHAETNDQPCLLAAQSWPRQKRVQIAIADTGIGIRKSLSANRALFDRLHLSNACEVASEYGITSKPTGHSGYGLTMARDLMNNCGGTYLLLSDNEYFSPKISKNSNVHFFWQGTLLILEWSTKNRLNINSVYNNWPKSKSEEGDENDIL